LNSATSEAIALALELRADLLLIDEARGRSVASRLGLKPTGVLAMLVQGKERGHIASVRSLIENLEATIQFRLSEQLRREILRDAGEAT
jgi:uncharacterized protein